VDNSNERKLKKIMKFIFQNELWRMLLLLNLIKGWNLKKNQINKKIQNKKKLRDQRSNFFLKKSRLASKNKIKNN